MRYSIALSFLLCFSTHSHGRSTQQKTPQLTLVIIIDQFAYNYLYKLQPFLKGGIKYLLQNGTVYENAHYQYAMPETAAGHATLQTGTLPKDHGIIANAWFADGKHINSDDDDSGKSFVFGPRNTTQPYGKSAHFLMVDGLSDQFMLQSQPNSPHHVIGLSLKSRAAIFAAGSLGTPFWFDTKMGMFTSSEAYMESLPTWVKNFNTTLHNQLQHGCTWHLAYPNKPKAYNFYDINNYKFGGNKESLIEKDISITRDTEEPYTPFEATPCANQMLINLAKQCIDHYCDKKNKTLLWLSLSSLDFIAHQDGPYAKDSIDMIYHIDKQLTPLIEHAMRAVGRQNVLFVLTADHGVMPLQGILQEHKLQHVYRYQAQDIIDELNNAMLESLGIKDIVLSYQAPTLYLDTEKLYDLEKAMQDKLISTLKKILLAKPGIKNVWTAQELNALCFDASQELESYYKHQLYAGRSGNLVIQPQPYTLLAKHSNGTTHETPYNYDTHVPLIFYQPMHSKKKKIIKKVYTTQVANTLAQMLHVPKPSASTAEVLPGLFRNQ